LAAFAALVHSPLSSSDCDFYAHEISEGRARVRQLTAQNDLAQAISLLEQMKDLIERECGVGDSLLRESLNDLGVLYKGHGRLDEAETVLRRALELESNYRGADTLASAVTLNNLAQVLEIEGRFEEGEAAIKRSLKIREAKGSPLDVAVALNTHGLLLLKQNRYREAESAFTESLGIRKQLKGPKSPEYATALNNLALVDLAEGHYADAESRFREVIRIRENAGLENASVLAETIGNLAVLYRTQRRYEEAGPLYDRSFALLTSSLHSDSPSYSAAENNLAVFRAIQGRFAEAETLYQQALTRREKMRNVPGTIVVLVNLSTLYGQQHRYAEAEAALHQAADMALESSGPNSLARAEVLNSLGGMALEQSHYADAGSLLTESLRIREATLRPDHPLLVQSLFNVGALRFLEGDWGAAMSNVRRGVGIAIKRERLGAVSNDERTAQLQQQSDSADVSLAIGIFLRAARVQLAVRCPLFFAFQRAVLMPLLVAGRDAC